MQNETKPAISPPEVEPKNSTDPKQASSGSGRQRQIQEAIASLVNSLPQGTHLTAPEVHRRAREIGLDVSLSTIYRTLNTLKDSGNVTTLVGERGTRYEAAVDGHDHDHLICLKCGLTIEFVDDLIKGFGKSVAQRKGYEHKSSRFDILGLCSECQAQDQDHKIEHAIDCLVKSSQEAEQAISLCRIAVTAHQARKTARANESAQLALEKLTAALNNCDQAITLFLDSRLSKKDTGFTSESIPSG